jgi:hypothetical protein
MPVNTYKNDKIKFQLPVANTDELRSKQSVRTTFKLSEKTILALNLVSNQLGVKQKSLFDHLIADTDALGFIARELQKATPKRVGGIQKTVVVSRSTLAILQKIAQTYNAPRDALVELSIQRLKPVIEQEKAKLATRKQIAAKVKSSLANQRQLLEEATQKLGAEDPICDQLASALNRFENTHAVISAFVEKCESVMAYEV